jgi:branched-chain amino acid aminotransferase
MKTEIFQNVVIYNSQLIEKSDINFNTFVDGNIVYEIIRVVNGIPLFLEDHLMRLYYSANIAGFNIGITTSEIMNSIKHLSIENQSLNGNVKILFHYNKNSNLSFLFYFIKHSYPNEVQYRHGVKVALHSAERKTPNAKIIDDSFRNTTNEIILKEKIYELLLVNNNGWITEGSKSNVFFIKDNTLITAPIRMVLPGITRKFILKIAQSYNINIIEECVHQNDIDKYDAAFISGTSPKVLAISSINDVKYNVNNPLIKMLTKGYNEEIENYIYDAS